MYKKRKKTTLSILSLGCQDRQASNTQLGMWTTALARAKDW